MELFCFSLQNKDEQCFDIFFVRSARLILCKQSNTRTFDRSHSWAIHSNFGPIKCRFRYIKLLYEACLKLSFDWVLKVLLLEKFYWRKGCGKLSNRILLQILCFRLRILLGLKSWKFNILCFAAKFTIIYIVFDSSFALSLGVNVRSLGERILKMGVLGWTCLEILYWESSYIWNLEK